MAALNGPRSALTPPTTLEPPPKGMIAMPASLAERKNGEDLFGAARIDDSIGRDGQIARAQSQKVVIGTAERMERALIRIVAHAIGAHNRDEHRAFRRRQARRRERDLFQRSRGRCKQARHAEFAGQPVPYVVARGECILVRGPTPAVPPDRIAFDGHGLKPSREFSSVS